MPSRKNSERRRTAAQAGSKYEEPNVYYSCHFPQQETREIAQELFNDNAVLDWAVKSEIGSLRATHSITTVLPESDIRTKRVEERNTAWAHQARIAVLE